MCLSIKKLFFFTFLSISFSLAAQDLNLAKDAKITASSILHNDTAADLVADGVIGVDGLGEWVCKGIRTSWGYIELPWIQLDWDFPQKVNRIIVYDRPTEKEDVASLKLTFSDGSVHYMRRIPENGNGHEIKFDTKTIDWVKIQVTDAEGKDVGLSEIEVLAAPQHTDDPIAWVDPYIESSRGRYIFFITGSRPFGMASAAPMTRNKNQYGGGYNYNSEYILGFHQIHSWMIGGLEVMPAPSNIDPTGGHQSWKSRFSHEDEIVAPGFQRVFLRDHNIWVENTATDRVSFYKYNFTEDMEAQIITNLGGVVNNNTMTNAEVNKVSPTEIEGSFSTVDRFWGGPKDVKIFFVATFDKPFKQMNAWEDEQHFQDVNEIVGDSAGVSNLFDVKAGEELKMKIAISYTSIENARNNMEQELPHWDFEQVKDESRTVWNEWLGKIKVKGGTYDQKVKLYTDLWHVLLGRHKINDISGDYPDRTTGERDGNFTDAVFKVKTLPKDEEGNLKFNMYNSDAWWLSQWNLNILWGLAWPEVMDEMSASMVQYAENGYLLPRGPSGGGYSYIMTSSPATNLIAATFQKGLLTKIDSDVAYQKVKQNLLPGGMLGDAEDVNFYTENGYWPGNAGITLEAAFQDYALSQWAAKTGRKDDADFFAERSMGWPTLFKENHNLIFPKNKDGEFLHDDPLSGVGWVEANAWQATWSVSHAIPELALLMDGEEVLTEKLNHAFEMAKDDDFVFGYSEGYLSYANQPGVSNAHVFSHAGKPWLTQYWVRRVKEQANGGTTPELGYGGHDEDQGQMGGVSALMAIGLFSLKGNVDQDPVYEITSPIFDEIVIELDPNYYPGKTFTIKTKNNSKENMFIQKAFLNGKEHDQYWFSHDIYKEGGELEIILGPEPNKLWGVDHK